ncbi:hypothetical protein [Lysobacter niastensis]|uniref:Uncharacterized protein n=1 Tax=Lysobacter niastensis TaxID=380629 RepID=A0ABS0B5A0_9GAMM|nr:hypothetical protein [Lysobacter niastensis]MBF6023178.1 hypothetical protein [Lysobacter niastensis]
MNDERKAAIDLDQIQDKPLNSISAADFLEALGRSGHSGALMFRAWPEKKKYELFVEPEFSGGISVGGLLGRFAEKKKYEIEKDWRPEIHKPLRSEVLKDWTPEIPKPPSEFEFNPKEWLHDPAFIRQVATEVAAQLKSMGR